MGKHNRKRRQQYIGNGKHRAVTPKSDRNKARVAVVLPLAASLVLYPALAGNDEGRYGVPNIGAIIPILNPPSAAAEEVITDPTEVVTPPVVDLDSPAG